MANTPLANQAGASGTYNGETHVLESGIVSVLIVDGLDLTLTADKVNWADDSLLTYTIVIDNQTDLPFETPTVTDTLATDLIEFVEGTATLNGDPVTPTYVGGVLSLSIPTVIEGERATITFQVRKII